MLSEKVFDELELAYLTAKQYASAFQDAIKEQAEKHGLDPQALAKFVRAKANDNFDKLHKELSTIEQLAFKFGPVESQVFTPSRTARMADTPGNASH